VDEFCLGNREGESPGRRNAAQGAKVALQELNIAPVGRGGNRNDEIIHIGDYYALGDHWV